MTIAINVYQNRATFLSDHICTFKVFTYLGEFENDSWQTLQIARSFEIVTVGMQLALSTLDECS